MVGKTLAVLMLSRNFVMDRVTSLNNKANPINPSAFLSQRNLCMVKQEHLNDMISKAERSMDVFDAHKSKVKTLLNCISTMMPILELSSLCINMDSIIIAITIADNPLPILHQFLIEFNKIINSTKWSC